jgi:hypothetical protein
LGVARPANLLNYADTVLSDWITNGRGEKPLKPVAHTNTSKHNRPGKSHQPGAHQGIRDYLEKHGGIPDGNPD